MRYAGSMIPAFADSPRFRNWRPRLLRFHRLSQTQRSQLLLNRLERWGRRMTLLTGPRTLDIVPTHRCNLRCVGCVHYEAQGPADLEPDLFREILDESAPWAIQYRFCSLGEPLLNQHLPQILEMAARRGIGCNIMTNGTLMTPELADSLLSSARIDILTFSIDGARAETVERLRDGLSFELLLSGIAAVVRAKRRRGLRAPVVQANFIAMRESIEELPDLVRLASEIGIDDVNVNYLTVEGDVDLPSSLFGCPGLQKQVFGEARRVAAERRVVLHLPPDIDDTSFRARCFLPWDTMIIDTDGTARMCYCSWEESVGNVRADGGVCAVWNNALYREIRRTIESDVPFYRYCAHCGRRVGYSRVASHLGKGEDNEALFQFDWERAGTPGRPTGTRLVNAASESARQSAAQAEPGSGQSAKDSRS
jgi:MoaA/NifB/PqqE/SkfB family radical SAM enzyme